MNANFSRYRIAVTVAILFSLLPSITGQSTVSGTLIHKGMTRKYRLRIPAAFTPNETLPLVFSFHGFTSNAVQQESMTGMNAVADTARFLVCYPEGINASWNVGWVFGSTADDVGFTSALIDELYATYNIDRNRVYACGMSNGGFMSYRLACELPSRIAAIASVTGSMVPGAITGCKPGRPVPILEMHGTADNVVSYNGTAGIAAPIPDVLRLWQKNNGCDGVPVKTPLPDLNPNDGTTTEKWTYQNCSFYGDLVHYRIQNGAHTWPGAAGNAGGTSRDFHGSTAIWHFFREQRLPQTSHDWQSDQSLSFEAWPNPVPGQLTLSFAEVDTYHISVRTLTGREVERTQVSSFQAELDLSRLDSGLYVITVGGTSRLGTLKIVKL